MDWQKVSTELAKKLDPANVKPAQKYGPKGDYIEGWLAMAEANRIFGFDGWSYSLMDCKVVMERERKIGKAPYEKDGWGVTYAATVRVVVDGVTRDDVGAGHGYDVDLGMAHESAIKEAVTDALKRGLRSFGNPFGLALYDKSRENVGVNVDDKAQPEPDAEKATHHPQDEAVYDKLIAAIRKNGVGFSDDAAFKKTLGNLRNNDPVLAAYVDAEIASKREGIAA